VDIRSICGSIVESTQTTEFENEIVTTESHSSISESILTSISFMVAQLEMDFKKSQTMYDQEQEQLIHEFSQSVKKRFEVQTAIYRKLTEILKVVGMFLKLNLNASSATCLFDTTTNVYQLLAEIAKFVFNVQKETNKKESVPKEFHELISKTKTLLSQFIYESISQYNTNQANEEKMKMNTVTKESRLFPKLIFNIEQFEQFMISLSTLVGVNFMKDMKVSTVRIFTLSKKSKPSEDLEDKEPQEEEETHQDEEEVFNEEDFPQIEEEEQVGKKRKKTSKDNSPNKKRKNSEKKKKK
jgi:fanconi anemia group I protein